MITNETFLKEMSRELFRVTGRYNVYQRLCGRLTLEDLYTTDSVYIAACHCASGFRGRQDTFTFMRSAWMNSRHLAREVVEGRFTPRYYREKTITERGKTRVIRPPRFECKVVQKVLCDYMLRMLLESKMVYDNYASIRGRGTERCYRRVLEGLNRFGGPGSVVVMTDFSNFFGSIDHDVLEEILSGYIADPRVVALFMSFCEGDSGLSLGNEASQVPASFFPSMIDHEMKDHLGVKAYCRYMDDIFFIAPDAETAEAYLGRIRAYAERLHLVLKEEKIARVPWGRDFAFCKERFIFNREDRCYYRLMNPEIVRTEMRKLQKFEEKYRAGEMSRADLDAQVRTVLGMIGGRVNTHGQCERIEVRWKEITGGRRSEAIECR